MSSGSWQPWLLIALLMCACKFPHHLDPNDPSDAPQSEARNELKNQLSDITFLPVISSTTQIREVAEGPIFSRSRDLVVLFAPADCASLYDTCVKELKLYRWNLETHRFQPYDSLYSRTIVHIASFDLTHDGSDEIILYTATHPAKKLGMQVLGLSGPASTLSVRFQSDTVLPQIAAIAGKAYALIEYDSIAAKLMTGVSVRMPKRYYALVGQTFSETPSDPYWAQLVQHIRDSTHQIFLVSREEMSKKTRPDAAMQRSFVAATIAEALIDSTWPDAQLVVQRVINEFVTKLSPANYNTLLKLSLLNRATPFVRQTLRPSPQTFAYLNDLDDAMLIRDSLRSHAILLQLVRLARTGEPLYKAASALVSHNMLIGDADIALARALEIEPRSVSAMRLRAHVYDIRGASDSSRALLFRSLQFDSVSSEALRIRMQLTAP